MCGRYTLTADAQALQGRFAFMLAGPAPPPRYNLAPTQAGLTVIAGRAPGEPRRGGLLRWGLVPSWAKDPSIGSRMINARAETLAEKPAFRAALRQRRCLVLADGFYEWQGQGRDKRPCYISLREGQPLAFAGLWETWRPPSGEPLHTFTIVTIEANDLLRPLHPRMPVILTPQTEDLWLDGSITDPALLGEALRPYPPEAMRVYPVSGLVNSPAHDTPDCLTPLAA